jgi:hypothetical protein
MRTVFVLFIIVFSLCVSGCAKKPPRVAAAPPVPKSAPPPPPEPQLSTPQTNVRLPAPQPVSPEALASIPRPEPEPPAPPEVARPKPPRRATALGPPPPKPEAPTEPVPAAQEPPRPRLQTLMTAEERRRLGEEMDAHRREIGERLAQAGKSPSEPQLAMINRVRSFLALADQAARRGDMRQAHSLSERALLLARDLSSAR